MKDPMERLRLLTKKEAAIMLLHGQGYTSTEIAERLGRSKKTIAAHKHNIIMALGIRKTSYGKLAFEMAFELAVEAIRRAKEAGASEVCPGEH